MAFVNPIYMNLRLQSDMCCPVSSPAHHVEKLAQAGDPTTTASVHHWCNGYPAVRPRAVTLTLTVDREQRTSTCNQLWPPCYITLYKHYPTVVVYRLI